MKILFVDDFDDVGEEGGEIAKASWAFGSEELIPG